MDYLEFIARVTSHIPDKGQVIIRYSGTGSRGFCRIFLNIRHNKVEKSILFLAFFEALFQDCQILWIIFDFVCFDIRISL